MALNKDGLEIGQPVDFYTMMRVNRQRKVQKDEDSAEAKPAKRRGRPKKEKDDQADEQDLPGDSSADIS